MPFMNPTIVVIEMGFSDSPHLDHMSKPTGEVTRDFEIQELVVDGWEDSKFTSWGKMYPFQIF